MKNENVQAGSTRGPMAGIAEKQPSPHPDPLPSHPMGAEREQQANGAGGSEVKQHAPMANQNDEGEGEAAGESERALRGKIARLPKGVREKLNRRMDDGEAAASLCEWLNGLPVVKAVLAAHFGGKAINHRNISNWRKNGFKRWEEKQELLDKVTEMTEEAGDIAEASKNRLIRATATLACVKLLKQLQDANASGADVTKIAFAIAALNSVELTHVRVKHEERRLHQKDELVTLAWDKHLRDTAAIAERIKDDEQIAAIKQMPIDFSHKIDLIGRRLYGECWRRRRLRKTDDGGQRPEETREPEGGGQKAEGNAPEPSPHPNEELRMMNDEAQAAAPQPPCDEVADPPTPGGYGAAARELAGSGVGGSGDQQYGADKRVTTTADQEVSPTVTDVCPVAVEEGEANPVAGQKETEPEFPLWEIERLMRFQEKTLEEARQILRAQRLQRAARASG